MGLVKNIAVAAAVLAGGLGLASCGVAPVYMHVDETRFFDKTYEYQNRAVILEVKPVSTEWVDRGGKTDYLRISFDRGNGVLSQVRVLSSIEEIDARDRIRKYVDNEIGDNDREKIKIYGKFVGNMNPFSEENFEVRAVEAWDRFVPSRDMN